MGANQQTSVPAFTAGQVLTAQQQTEINTGVPVFADATARNAAFGGTGEKVLAEGQLAYLEDSNIVQYYDGSSWLTVGPASPGGLVYVTGAAFTSVTSFSLPNGTFTSTYRNYRVLVDITNNASDGALTMRYRTSGTDNTSSTYIQASAGIRANDGNASNVNQNNASSFTLATAASTFGFVIGFDVYDPQQSLTTHASGYIAGVDSVVAQFIGRSFNGFFNNTTVFDSLSIISATASNMTGVYRVYGYADS